MKHRTFFWFFMPTGLAMLLFIAMPIVSVTVQSMFTPHEAVFLTVETCTPFKCTEETTIDQEATAALRAGQPLGRFVGLDIYLDRGHLAISEVGEAWTSSQNWTEFLASHGFVVMACDHPGSARYTQIDGQVIKPGGARSTRKSMESERPRDVLFLIDSMQQLRVPFRSHGPPRQDRLAAIVEGKLDVAAREGQHRARPCPID